VVWWLIPLVATLTAWVYLRLVAGRVRGRRALAPGSPEDAADLERFAAALRTPMPGAPPPGALAPGDHLSGAPVPGDRP
jgi:hypothetical protein